MKSLYKYILFIALLSSCISEKKREEICKTCTLSNTRKDSVRVEIKEKKVPYYLHDTITQWLVNPCAYLCDSVGNLLPFEKEVSDEKGEHKTKIYTKNNRLYWMNTIDSLKKIITTKDTNTTHVIETTKEVPARCDLEHTTSFDHFCRWFFYITGSIILLHFILMFFTSGKVGLIMKIFKKVV